MTDKPSLCVKLKGREKACCNLKAACLWNEVTVLLMQMLVKARLVVMMAAALAAIPFA